MTIFGAHCTVLMQTMHLICAMYGLPKLLYSDLIIDTGHGCYLLSIFSSPKMAFQKTTCQNNQKLQFCGPYL